MAYVEKRVTQIKLVNMHTIVYKRAPDYLVENVNSYVNTSGYETHTSEFTFSIQNDKQNVGLHTFETTGMKPWNDLLIHARFIRN